MPVHISLLKTALGRLLYGSINDGQKECLNILLMERCELDKICI